MPGAEDLHSGALAKPCATARRREIMSLSSHSQVILRLVLSTAIVLYLSSWQQVLQDMEVECQQLTPQTLMGCK